MSDTVVTMQARDGKRKRLPEEVASHVRELIISGQVRPGEFLRIEPIAAAVGVSNTPVREGLVSLRSEGFVQLVPRRGFVVAPFTRQDVRDLFWTQARLAGELAARAATKITGERIVRLETILEEHETAISVGDEGRIADLGHAFHREINLAAGSHRLTLLLNSVVQRVPNRFYAAIEGHVAATRHEHPLLLDALCRGKAHEARSLMQQHIAEGADHLVDILEERGLWSRQESAS
ncbi:GntR family transcriptional regulator [Streptomyces viridiviolaceus]|uniref:GntR family transcriptional regulator n=1 Tax=Streptomyces viridiviolaceus TaxID=68282 RepID=A0ABW2DSP8_9ACTN|nr:GntR family transcriptional regulator [Streptomyces viridiviolaceus]GHB73614.1 GntR family transcriptional regulator [Streptomyces viridiviolaceus]